MDFPNHDFFSGMEPHLRLIVFVRSLLPSHVSWRIVLDASVLIKKKGSHSEMLHFMSFLNHLTVNTQNIFGESVPTYEDRMQESIVCIDSLMIK